MQPVPKAVYRSDFRENTNFCPQRDANLGPLAPQASVLPLDHSDLHFLVAENEFLFLHWMVLDHLYDNKLKLPLLTSDQGPGH